MGEGEPHKRINWEKKISSETRKTNRNTLEFCSRGQNWPERIPLNWFWSVVEEFIDLEKILNPRWYNTCYKCLFPGNGKSFSCRAWVSVVSSLPPIHPTATARRVWQLSLLRKSPPKKKCSWDLIHARKSLPPSGKRSLLQCFRYTKTFNLARNGGKSLERVLNMQEVTDGKYLLGHLAHSFSSAGLFSTVT